MLRAHGYAQLISTHALREEGDRDAAKDVHGGRGISTHALREEGDLNMCKSTKYSTIFLPTPSARRATFAILSLFLFSNFYPRPPRGGRPSGRYEFRHSRNISTHALREEGDRQRCAGRLPCTGISTHALREEGDGPGRAGRCAPQHFYPRPPRGGRLPFPLRDVVRRFISTHALREEGDRHHQRQRF